MRSLDGRLPLRKNLSHTKGATVGTMTRASASSISPIAVLPAQQMHRPSAARPAAEGPYGPQPCRFRSPCIDSRSKASESGAHLPQPARESEKIGVLQAKHSPASEGVPWQQVHSPSSGLNFLEEMENRVINLVVVVKHRLDSYPSSVFPSVRSSTSALLFC